MGVGGREMKKEETVLVSRESQKRESKEGATYKKFS
jgi:hypothetical protein